MNTKLSMYNHLWQSLKANRKILIQTTDHKIAARVAKAVRKRKDLDKVFRAHRLTSGKKYIIRSIVSENGKLLTLTLTELNSIDTI